MTRADFNDLVRQLNRNLYGYAFRILRNQEEAEDAVQEVFIKLWNLGVNLMNIIVLGTGNYNGQKFLYRSAQKKKAPCSEGKHSAGF
jgi:DNA-directed RNA polymerase specialized sigma24 family protein